jgi:hypothetical protein
VNNLTHVESSEMISASGQGEKRARKKPGRHETVMVESRKRR